MFTGDNYLGYKHIQIRVRKPTQHVTKQALTWKRKRGRTRNPSRIEVEPDISKADYKWKELEAFHGLRKGVNRLNK